MDLLKQRLDSAGLGDFEFVLQDDDEAPRQTASNTANTNNNTNNGQEEADNDVVHVKTLIWEAEIRRRGSCPESSGTIPPESMPIQWLYFATALCCHDRVDEDILKQRLSELDKNTMNGTTSKARASTDKKQPAMIQIQEVISLKLAETVKAEELAGYMSGTIPPLGHTTPLLLIVDQALVHSEQEHNINNNNSTTIATEQPRKRTKMLSTGSGSFRHSLWIRCEDMLHYAQVLGDGICIASISASSTSQQQQQPPLNKNNNTSSYATEGQDATLCKRTSNDDDDDNDEHDEKDKNGHGPNTAIPIIVSDEMKSLGRLLRDSALREGKAKVIRTVISQAGDRFPQVGSTFVGAQYKLNSDIVSC